ncbi:MAG: response regulator [Prochloraceae cyanobacterium]|nr:response regulator [Prochloraceae cyanobacterium]
MNIFKSDSAKILVVDNNLYSRTQMLDLLSLDGYQVVETDGNSDIITQVVRNNPDLVLLDVMMPYTDGFEVCKHIKQDRRTCLTRIILTGVSDDRKSRLRCIESGGDDLLVKPLDRLLLSARVRSIIEQKRLYEGLDQTEQLLFSIATAIESRSCDRRHSFAELISLAKSFGEYLELSKEDIKNLVYAAYLHDIGTVAVPDSVLLKKGKLTDSERETIEKHVLVGEKICQPLKGRGILPIIRHHHERWDGSGYPDSLKGNEIPWLAQIFQILDIYEALISERPYKKPLTPTEALDILAEEAAKGWRNSKLVGKFTAFINASQIVSEVGMR